MTDCITVWILNITGHGIRCGSKYSPYYEGVQGESDFSGHIYIYILESRNGDVALMYFNVVHYNMLHTNNLYVM